LASFAQDLEQIIGRPTPLRPFVCDGNPLACGAFLVGFNPATALQSDFWNYWSDRGFERSRWLEDYVAEREARPLREGKKRRTKMSPSRRVIDWIVQSTDCPLLETNLYAQATQDMRALSEQDMRPFLFLVEAIMPKVIVAHGIPAHAALSQIKPEATVVQVPHFSRGWSREKALVLGQQVKALLGQ
jgi:hypothetical protein